MKKGMLLGVAALSLGLMSLPGTADAHGRDRHHHRRGGIHIGVDLGGVRHYRSVPVYGYGYGYGDYDYSDYDYGDYGYGTYYSAPYPYYTDTYYVRTPRIYVHRDGYRSNRRSHSSWRDSRSRGSWRRHR